MEYQRYIK